LRQNPLLCLFLRSMTNDAKLLGLSGAKVLVAETLRLLDDGKRTLNSTLSLMAKVRS